MDFILLLQASIGPQVQQSNSDIIRDVILLSLIGVLFFLYIRDAKKRKVKSIHQALTTDSINTFRFFGEMSTILEVIGLIIISVWVTHSMGLFNATVRYVLVGFLEVLLTLRFQALILDDYYDAYTNNAVSSSGAKVTTWERIKIIGKSLPVFLMGFFFTTIIFCFYMESIGAVRVVLLEGNGGFFKMFSSIRLEYSSSIWSRIEFSGIILIYMTPILNIIFTMDTLFSSEEKIIKIIKVNEFHSNNPSSGTPPPSTNPPPRSNNNPPSGNPQPAPNPQPNPSPPPPPPTSTTDLNSFISLKDEIVKMFDIVKNFGGNVGDFGFTPDELYRFVCQKCGVNATSKQVEIFTGITAKEVEDYISSFDVATGTAAQGKSPVEFYENTLKKLIYGDGSANNLLLGKLLTVHNSYKTTEKTLAEENLKLSQIQRDIGTTNDQSEKDRLNDEKHNVQVIITSLQDKLNNSEGSLQNLCQTIPVMLNQKMSGIGMRTA